MSAGGILEIPAFLTSLSGIANTVEHIIRVWRKIAAAKDFGRDVVDLKAKLSFEYFIFLTWCRTTKVLPDHSHTQDSGTGSSAQPGTSTPTFEESMQRGLDSPFYLAISSILTVLKGVEKLFQDYDIIQTTPRASVAHAMPQSAAHNQSLYGAEVVSEPDVLANKVNDAEAEVKSLQHRNSFRKRFSFYSSISKSPDRKRFESLVKDFTYWNSKLYDYLPNSVREVVFSQILPAKVFEKSQGTEALSTIRSSVRGVDRYASLEQGAHLWIEVQEAEREEWPNNVNDSDYERSINSVMTKNIKASETLRELTTYTYDAESPEGTSPQNKRTKHVYIEWCSYKKWNFEQRKVSVDRAKRLVHLTSSISRLAPTQSRILECIGYIKHTKQDYLGLLFEIPAGVDCTKDPMTLHDLFYRNENRYQPRELILEKKFQLSRDMAVTLGTFHRVRWYHKNLSCHSVFAFRPEPPQSQYNFYIGGFDFARPDGPRELSLNPADGSPRWLPHAHPELQAGEGERPRFCRRHDIYSLGVVLFQIGIWDVLDKYTMRKGKTLSVSEFHSRLLKAAPILIPPRMGAIYAEVTVWCLKGGDDDVPGQFELENELSELMIESSPSGSTEALAPQTTVDTPSDIPLQTFYWKVVRRLAECHCQSMQ